MTAPLTQTARRLPDRIRLRDGTLIETRAPRFEDLHTLARGIPELRGEHERLVRLTNPHGALVAVAPDRQPIGLARMMRAPVDSDLAHLAVAVVEQWRGRGVGTALLSRLADTARGLGVDRFALVCLAAPAEARALLEELGPATLTDGHGGLVAVHIELPARVGYGAPLSHVLRRIAAGRVNAACTLDRQTLDAA